MHIPPIAKKTKERNSISSLWHLIVMKCACCGGDMLPEKDIGDSIIYKCAECGLSDSRVKKKQEKRVDIGQEVTRDKRI
jgi:DNA-directed RNA polymerase subunit M/transcription elongation factor TFIIS